MLCGQPAHAVLTDPFVVSRIVSFQQGLPHDIVELARARRADFPKYNPKRDMMAKIPGGILPTIAIEDNNLKLLQRLFRYTQDQPTYETCPQYMTFRYVWRDCLKHGDIAMIEWVNAQPSLRDGYRECTRSELQNAFANVRSYETVVWLLTHRPEYKDKLSNTDLQVMVSIGTDRLRLFQWLEANVPDLPYANNVMDAAAVAGQMDLMQYLHTHRTEGCTENAMDNAAKFGQLEVVRFLHTNRPEGCTTHAMDWAAEGGHLDVVQFLHENRTVGCTKTAMDWAGNLRVLRFLHGMRTEGCTKEAMDRAASFGKLSMVKFLHESRSEGCTTKAMAGAASGGHLDVVHFLHENRTEGCTQRAMDDAASNGHLEVVQFLFEKRNLRGTPSALEEAASNGHFEIIRFFHDNQDKCDYVKAIQGAARGGHLDMLQYLLEISPESCSDDAMREAATEGHLHIVKFLHDLFHHEYCPPFAVAGAAFCGHFQVVKYLNENCTQWSTHTLVGSARYGYLPIVQYLVEKRDDGCLVNAQRMAKRSDNPLVVEYLTSIICNWKPYHNCQNQPRRLCQKRV